jgi:hypothetical protein
MSAAVLVPYNEREDRAFEVDTLSLPQLGGNESRRLALQQTAIVPWMGGLLERWDPCMVIVEEPFAGNINRKGKKGHLHVPKESYHVIGILLAVLGQFGVRVDRMGPTSWKALALGEGAGMTKKPELCKVPPQKTHAWRAAAPGEPICCAKCGVDYPVLSWARQQGYAGASWDEADAVGIATAGGVLLERESRP